VDAPSDRLQVSWRDLGVILRLRSELFVAALVDHDGTAAAKPRISGSGGEYKPAGKLLF